MGNFFRCYFSQLILNIILVPYFCQLKPKITLFSTGFQLKYLQLTVRKFANLLLIVTKYDVISQYNGQAKR